MEGKRWKVEGDLLAVRQAGAAATQGIIKLHVDLLHTERVIWVVE